MVTPDDDGLASQEEPSDGAEVEGRQQLTSNQTEPFRRAIGIVGLPRFTLPESTLRGIADLSGMVEARQAVFASTFKPLLDAQAAWQKRINANLTSEILKGLGPSPIDFGRITDRLTQNIDFSGIAQSLDFFTKINANFAEQQSTLFKNLVPAIKALQASFYPPNLRAIDDLDFEDVHSVVMIAGIPLYGLPRTTIAEALIRAHGASKRRDILGRRWRTITADCREAVQSCSSSAVAPYIPFALAALDALQAGHTAAAQALAGSLVDTIVTSYFGEDRSKYTPHPQGKRTTDAYDEFTVREYIAFAPMWQTYQQFRVTDGDKVPATFSRHATAHAVSSRQYSRRNAVQAVMFACSLLYRLDEEAATIDVSS